MSIVSCSCGCMVNRESIIDHLYSDEHTSDEFILPWFPAISRKMDRVFERKESLSSGSYVRECDDLKKIYTHARKVLRDRRSFLCVSPRGIYRIHKSIVVGQPDQVCLYLC